MKPFLFLLTNLGLLDGLKFFFSFPRGQGKNVAGLDAFWESAVPPCKVFCPAWQLNWHLFILPCNWNVVAPVKRSGLFVLPNCLKWHLHPKESG